jgi:alkanesulfonate monooxygenase SsuD/methylene tetrahydromethanopterin reductase-like flavin-dependent oxidoreductase (luciferase family)
VTVRPQLPNRRETTVVALKPEIGVSLPIAGDNIPDVAAAARHAETAGLDSVWVGDHLADGRPILDSTIALAAAAAATERVRVGFGILQLALRHPAWAAKQIGSIQYLSRNRLILGVGVGGSAPDEWAAAGVPLRVRGLRTDLALAALPRLLQGKPTSLTGEPGAPYVTLQPSVPTPPIWIGGTSDRALRRAVEYGDDWLPAVTPPDEIVTSGEKMHAMAQEKGRPTPRIASVVMVAATRSPNGSPAAGLAQFLSGRLGIEADRAAKIAVGGNARQIADQLGAYVAAGVHHLVLGPFGPNWQEQFDIFAEARQLMTE